MEETYAYTNQSEENKNEKRVFFRGHTSAIDIVEMAKSMKFEPYSDSKQLNLGFNMQSYDVDLDTGSACGESCEIGADD